MRNARALLRGSFAAISRAVGARVVHAAGCPPPGRGAPCRGKFSGTTTSEARVTHCARNDSDFAAFRCIESANLVCASNYLRLTRSLSASHMTCILKSNILNEIFLYRTPKIILGTWRRYFQHSFLVIPYFKRKLLPRVFSLSFSLSNGNLLDIFSYFCLLECQEEYVYLKMCTLTGRNSY